MKKFSLKLILILMGLVISLFIASIFIKVNKSESLFFNLYRSITYNKEDWRKYNNNKLRMEMNDIDTSHDSVDYAEQVVDLHPYDLHYLPKEYKEKEKQRVSNFNFDELRIARHYPSHQEVENALIRFTNGKLRDVIVNQNLNIKVGNCYENMNQEMGYSCVSCMILLFNRENNEWQSAFDGYNFLNNSYDFYQEYEGANWEAKELTQAIPFDDKLFEKYSKK